MMTVPLHFIGSTLFALKRYSEAVGYFSDSVMQLQVLRHPAAAPIEAVVKAYTVSLPRTVGESSRLEVHPLHRRHRHLVMA